MEAIQSLQGFKIALLIDFDNVILGVEDPGFDIELVVNALRSRGSVVMGRAYGDWYRHQRHRRKLMEHGIELVETPVFGPVIKNSADIRIVLDGFEIAMLQHHIDAFCLVSGDSDFLPLIKKLQYLGKHVIVISGNKFTSDLVRRNCNEFVSYENLLAESLGATEDVSTLEGAFILLSRGISTLHERGMEVRSSTVKQMMLQLNPAFSERNFSCAQFKQFLDKAVRAGVVKLGGRDQVSGEFMVFLSTDFDDETPDSKFQASNVEPALANRRTDSSPAPREPIQRESRERDVRERESRDNGRGRDRNRRRPEREADDKPEIIALPVSTEPAADDLITTLAGEVPTGDIAPTTSGHLLNRGLRRGRLRFSGKAGRAEVAADGSIVEEPTLAPQATPEAVAADVIAPVADVETSAPATIEAPEAALEAQAEKAPESESEDAPKKRATRRGGKAVKAKAAKSKAKTETSEPAVEAVSETPEVTAPVEVAPTSTAPVTAEPKPVGKPRTTSGRKSAPKRAKAAPPEIAPETTAPVAEVAAPPSAPNPLEVGLAAADNKPARRRSGRRHSGRKNAGEGEFGVNSDNAT